MSETASAARGGEFATSRRGGIAEDYDFIMQKALAGVPASAIARMVARPVADVRQVIGLSIQAQEPAATEIVPTELASFSAPSMPLNDTAETAVQYRLRSPWSRKRDFPPFARNIVRHVADRHGFGVEDLIGRKRGKRINAARLEACYALYTCGRGYTLWMIGSWFDGRDHTSILNNVRAHEYRMATGREAFARARKAA